MENNCQSNIYNLNTEEILKRVGEILKTQVKVRLAKALGVKKATLSNWIERNTIPFMKLYKFSVDYQISFVWLLTGNGDPHINKQDDTKAPNMTESVDDDKASPQMNAANIIDALTQEALQSNTPHALLLTYLIKSFHDSAQKENSREQEIADVRDNMKAMTEQFKILREEIQELQRLALAPGDITVSGVKKESKK